MITRILVPLDGSKIAEEALAFAVELGKAQKATIILSRVVAPVVPGRTYSPRLVDELQEAHVRDAEEYIEERRAALAADDVAAETHVLTGDVSKTIVEVADQASADLIVMSSHGLGGRGSHVFGSVAQKVLHGSTQPVLLVKPDLMSWEQEEEAEEGETDSALLGEMTEASANRLALPQVRRER